MAIDGTILLMDILLIIIGGYFIDGYFLLF